MAVDLDVMNTNTSSGASSQHMGEIGQLADRLRVLRERRAEMDEAAAEVGREITDVEGQLVERMVADDVQNIKQGGVTIYLTRKVYTRLKANTAGAIIAFCRSAGMGDFVRQEEVLNDGAFVAWVQEQKDADRPLPEVVEQSINHFERVGVAVKRGASAGR